MDNAWRDEFRERMRGFGAKRGGGSGVSIKVRVESGCFHREHSPEAFRLFDRKAARLANNVEWVEHESGPELLVYMAVTTAALSLAKSVVDLVTTIIKARSDGIKKGDHPREPLVVIVRRIDDKNEFREEIVMRLGHNEKTDAAAIEKKLNESIRGLFKGGKKS